MRRSVLSINRDLELDWLTAVEYGGVVDGQPDDHLIRVGEVFASLECVGVVLPRPRARPLGELTDARSAYERAIALDEEETDASELLTALREET